MGGLFPAEVHLAFFTLVPGAGPTRVLVPLLWRLLFFFGRELVVFVGAADPIGVEYECGLPGVNTP